MDASDAPKRLVAWAGARVYDCFVSESLKIIEGVDLSVVAPAAAGGAAGGSDAAGDVVEGDLIAGMGASGAAMRDRFVVV